MNYLPRLKVRQRMNAQPPGRVICQGHRKVVRTKYQCAIAGRKMKSTGEVHECYGRIDPHHETSRGAGGGDNCVVPLCRRAHDLGESPNWSWQRFKDEFGVNLEKMGAALWRADAYHRIKYEQDWRAMWGDVPLPYEVIQLATPADEALPMEASPSASSVNTKGKE